MEKWMIRAGRLEAISFLLLLFLAMPLKYYGGVPFAVRVFGPIHGVLFLAYLALAFVLAGKDDWHGKKLLMAMIASIIPCGTFWFERKYQKNIAKTNSYPL